MNKRYLLELLQKYNKGEATPEEELLLKNYYNLFESAGVQPFLNEQDKAALKAGMYNEIARNIAAGGPGRKNIRTISKPFLVKIAVAASLLVVCTTAYLHNIPLQHKTALAAASPKENRLIYLPDGSKVIVSWGSKFYCSASFGHGRREVYLEGQAYFDIFHDAAKPFVVHTGKLETTVLGTAFNIKALPGEEEITVTVTRGKVKVSDQKKILALLTPGNQVVFYKKADSSIRKAVSVHDKPDWKEQDLLVNNITVEEAAKLLEDRFNVHITVQDSLVRSNRFTTVFLKTESLEQILKSICLFNDAAYEYNKENAAVIIHKNNIAN